ncbi:YbaB/EbfC family nucleoid-associated protein [Micromonospora sp. NPDC000089]|uniref:YbaB/EbfC family nucleoid-associated protein n=1 Tax=unclassified Micromonospora TaxID=2617518 RepID=UPI0036C2D6A0
MESNDLDQMLEQVRLVSDQMTDMRDRLIASEVVGSSYDGAVTVTMTADAEFRNFRLDPELLRRARHEEIEDLVLEALKDAGAQLRRMTEERMSQVTEALSAYRG